MYPFQQYPSASTYQLSQSPIYYPVYPQFYYQNSPIIGQQQKQPTQQYSISDSPFIDSLDVEKLKYDSTRKEQKRDISLPFLNQNIKPSTNNSNIFSVGNHMNNFNQKSMQEVFASRDKKQSYAQLLQQQVQLKKDIKLEKNILEAKHDLAMRVQRTQNELPSYNMPARDWNGNVVQSRKTPGNRNYQPQDWFTHLPNINKRYIDNEDSLSQHLISHASSNQNQLMQHNYGLQSHFNNQNQNIAFRQSPLNNSNNNNNNLSINLQTEGNEDDNLFTREMDDQEEQEFRKVRIVTPKKFRQKTISTQTPHTLEEINNLTNIQIGELYPKEELPVVPVQTQEANTLTLNQRLGTSASRLPVKFTKYLKGEYKYANELDKIQKRNQYIELQNQQFAQMEEKKRQKEMAKLQEIRENELESLRIERERRTLQENEFQHAAGTSNATSFINGKTTLKNTSLIRLNEITSNNPQNQSLNQIETAIREEIAPLYDIIKQSNLPGSQVKKYASNTIPVTQFVEDVNQKELSQTKYLSHFEPKSNSQTDFLNSQTEFSIPTSQTNIDQTLRSRRNLELDDAEIYNKNKQNLDFALALREKGSDNPSKKSAPYNHVYSNSFAFRNNVDYVTYDDNFEKSTSQILNKQQQRIQSRLQSMGFKNNIDDSENKSNLSTSKRNQYV